MSPNRYHGPSRLNPGDKIFIGLGLGAIAAATIFTAKVVGNPFDSPRPEASGEPFAGNPNYEWPSSSPSEDASDSPTPTPSATPSHSPRHRRQAASPRPTDTHIYIPPRPKDCHLAIDSQNGVPVCYNVTALEYGLEPNDDGRRHEGHMFDLSKGERVNVCQDEPRIHQVNIRSEKSGQIGWVPETAVPKGSPVGTC